MTSVTALFKYNIPKEHLQHMRSIGHLLSLVRGGNRDAFGELYGRCYDKLMAVARKKLGDPVEAEDIVQDVFSNLWMDRVKIPTVPTMGYLMIILNRRCIDLLRKQGTRREYKDMNFVMQQLYDTQEPYENKELGAILTAAFSSLPIKMRQVCELFLVHQFTANQIAFELNISVQTIKNQIVNGKRLLKSYIIGMQTYGQGTTTKIMHAKRKSINREAAPDLVLLDAIDKLPKKMRTILKMQVVEKMAVADIANSLQLSFTTVHQHITAAHRKLRSTFGDVRKVRFK
ncbi:sigma-70 family RNA polymerase sigma factor [Chitinophaga sp. YIM B06452]|uniref:sigma-70 family RNA polymerase sigma factor n=1 Tax=Chitinophaga sp. YIM B06452 TaxID=3082158 RepID=UPI0031FE86B4